MNKIEYYVVSYFIKIVCIFIPSKKLRQSFRNRFSISRVKISKFSKKIKHKQDGIIYSPYYNLNDSMNKTKWELYNKRGEKLLPVFLREIHTAHNDFLCSEKIYFDRFAYSLDIHLYSHLAMLETMGSPTKRYGVLGESRAIVPYDYQIFRKYRGLEKDFDAIFTYDEVTLNTVNNAVFVPFCANLWYGRKDNTVLDDNVYAKKDKLVSIVSSDKEVCDLHKFRILLARKCKREGLADTYGTFDGGELAGVDKYLTNYMYSIAIENDISAYFYTEKILNCFASMTIPIYLGASKIDEFFNPDGIIKITANDLGSIDKILNKCTMDDYLSRLDAIKDNYQRALKYLNVTDNFLYRELRINQQ